MNEQCNLCGGHKDLIKCSFCPTTICEICKRNHEPYCEEIQKRKKRGEGPTVANTHPPVHRHGHEAPELIHIPSAAPLAAQEPAAMPLEETIIPVVIDAVVASVQQQLDAVKDLSKRFTDEEIEARLTAPLVLTVTPAPETKQYRRIVDDTNRANEAFVDILASTKLGRGEAEKIDKQLDAIKDLLK